MHSSKLPIDGGFLIEDSPFEDKRGRFTRLFCTKELADMGLPMDISQINHSLTRQVGTVRGMHFQYPPHADCKIIRCLKGKCFDVMVDLRKNSPTFLKWHGVVLSGSDKKAVYIPQGFAHGFQVLEEDTELLYFHSHPYTPEAEGAVRFDDPALSINWPLQPINVSERDLSHSFIDRRFQGIAI